MTSLISVLKYNNEIDVLENFCLKAKKDGILNNSEISKLSLPQNYGLFFTLVNREIAAMSYVHDFNNYYKDTWRCWTRTAVLKKFRNQYHPKQRNIFSAAGITGYSIPHQVDYALRNGAKQIVFTTNNEGSLSSIKLGQYLHKIVDTDPRFNFLETREIKGLSQDVWILNVSDLETLTSLSSDLHQN